MWAHWTEPYTAALAAAHLSPGTIRAHRRTLGIFALHLRADDPREATAHDLLAWHAHLGEVGGNATGTRNAKLRQRKNFYRWMHKSGRALTDPGLDLPILRTPRTLPRGVPNEAQMVRLLRAPDTETPTGLRDRAALELLYSCGLRSGELCRLTVYDPDFEKKTLRILQGKGRKDRIVPAGRAALHWLARYQKEVRPALALKKAAAAHGTRLFLGPNGNPLTTTILYRTVRRHAEAAKLPPTTTTHSLRHACATGMLKGGASVRHVQEILGHADITTTQIYTHLAKADLQAVHKKTAPSERRKDTSAPEFELTNWRPRKRKKPRRTIKK